MKFKEDMPLFSLDEISEAGLTVRSPEMLRVFVKWIDELEAMVQTPE